MGGAIHLSPVLQFENEIGSKPTSRNAVLPVSDHAGRVDFNGCFLKVLRNFCHKIDQITFCKSHLHSGKILAKSFSESIIKGREFSNFLRSLEQFILTVKDKNNFW